MITEKKCLQILNEVAEENLNNPNTELYFMTRCLKNWYIRIEIYQKMKTPIMTTPERRKLQYNKWGEDTTVKRLINERNLPLQNLLELIYQIQDIEFDMDQIDIYDRTHLVIPTMKTLITLFTPIWIEEVKNTTSLIQNKNHPDLRKLVYFALNLRDSDINNDEVIDFFIKLLNEHF